ncbi:MAG: amidohydrolase family protein [Burkholderiales bacterium]
MERIAFTRATVFDSLRGELRANGTVVVEGDRIADVLFDATPVDDARIVDLDGRTLMPGLIDAHVHVTSTVPDFLKLAMMPASLIAAQSKDILEGMLARGFTTVRDAAGADHGLVEAVERGHFRGPRLLIAGQAISQTGGHGDVRPIGVRQNILCSCAGLGMLGRIADGVSEVRKAAREQLRTGSHQIKVMAGGGVSSPTDPIDGTQYSMDELRAIVEEAEAANTYVMAHAYSPRSIVRAMQAGIRSIEHGNLVDEVSANEMKRAGAWLVPTLVTYDSLAREGAKLGWPDVMLRKLDRVRAAGIESLRIAKAAGVPIGFGTDLLGPMHDDQSNEFTIRAAAMSAVEVLQSATSVNARLIGREGELGVVARGALADLIVVDGDPTADLTLLQGQGARMPVVMQGGRFVRDRLA